MLLGLLILALADLRFQGSTGRQAVVAAVDCSLSTAGARKTADAFCQELTRNAGGNRLLFLPFAAQPGTATRNWPGDLTGLDPLATDLGAAVTAAGKLLPDDYVPKIVLLTDGNENRGNLLAAAARGRADLRGAVGQPGQSGGLRRLDDPPGAGPAA